MTDRKFTFLGYVIALEKLLSVHIESRRVLLQKIRGINSQIHKKTRVGALTSEHRAALELSSEILALWSRSPRQDRREKINKRLEQAKILAQSKTQEVAIMQETTETRDEPEVSRTIRYCSVCYTDLLPAEKECRKSCAGEIKTRRVGNDASCIIASAELATENPQMTGFGAGYTAALADVNSLAGLKKEPLMAGNRRNEMSIIG